MMLLIIQQRRLFSKSGSSTLTMTKQHIVRGGFSPSLLFYPHKAKNSLRWDKIHLRLFFHICIINIHTFHTQCLHSCFVCYRPCSCQQSTASLQEVLNSVLLFEYPNTRAKSSFLPVFAPQTFFYAPLLNISANARTEIRKQSPNFV